jgi:hypothetical protein
MITGIGRKIKVHLFRYNAAICGEELDGSTATTIDMQCVSCPDCLHSMLQSALKENLILVAQVKCLEYLVNTKEVIDS